MPMKELTTITDPAQVLQAVKDMLQHRVTKSLSNDFYSFIGIVWPVEVCMYLEREIGLTPRLDSMHQVMQALAAEGKLFRAGEKSYKLFDGPGEIAGRQVENDSFSHLFCIIK